MYVFTFYYLWDGNYQTNLRMSNVAYKHFTSKTPRCQQYVCPVRSPMQSRHKQSRVEDAEQNQTFLMKKKWKTTEI